MIKILFVCHGNICRSPMAEFIMKDLIKKARMDGRFSVASAAATTEELGSPMYPPALQTLKEHGIGIPANELGVGKKRAHLMTRRDYDRYDYIIGMDEENMRDMKRICSGDPSGKFFLLMEFAGKNKEVADPWYTRDFNATWKDCMEGCAALLKRLARRLPSADDTAVSQAAEAACPPPFGS